MEWLVKFWKRVADELCEDPFESSTDEEDEQEASVKANPWQQKWHRKFFEELLLLTFVEYDKANVTRDQYLLSLFPVKETILANTVFLKVDRELWDNPLWLTGTVSPEETRRKMEEHDAEMRELATFEERSLTQTRYFRSLPGARDYDIHFIRKYARALAHTWKEFLTCWTDEDGLARETHPEAYQKFAVRARRAWAATRIVEEKLNILFHDIPDRDVEKEELTVFDNGKPIGFSESLIELLTGHVEELEKLDGMPPRETFEWTSA